MAAPSSVETLCNPLSAQHASSHGGRRVIFSACLHGRLVRDCDAADALTTTFPSPQIHVAQIRCDLPLILTDLTAVEIPLCKMMSPPPQQ